MKLCETSPIRLSKWVHILERNGEKDFALYHALLIEVVFLQNKYKDTFDFLRRGTTLYHLLKHVIGTDIAEIEQIIIQLYGMQFIVDVEQNDQELLDQICQHNIALPGLETMYLLVTDSCNLSCEYCFINNNMPTDYKYGAMSWDTAKTAIDTYFRNIAHNPSRYKRFRKTIFFYGGEPLLNIGLIRKAVEYIEGLYDDYIAEDDAQLKCVIITNGTVINEGIAQFVNKHKILEVAISIDGPQHIHDQKRYDRKNCGSFERAIHGYKILRSILSEDRGIGISCTIDDHNVDMLPLLLDMQREFGFDSVNMNFLVDTDQKPVDRTYIEKASQRLIEYFDQARDEGVYEDRMMRKTKAFIDQRIYPYDCQALGAQIVVAPDGSIGVCHEGVGIKQFFFDHVGDDFSFHDNPVIREWKQRSPLKMPQCYHCSALGICGGGCAYSAWLRNGSIWSVDDRFCIHSLSTLEWLIWDLYSKMQ